MLSKAGSNIRGALNFIECTLINKLNSNKKTDFIILYLFLSSCYKKAVIMFTERQFSRLRSKKYYCE